MERVSLEYKAAGHSHSELYPTLPRLCTTAPPKALDEDEVAFLEGVARYEKAKEQQKAEQEAQELAAFGASCCIRPPLFRDGLCCIVSTAILVGYRACIQAFVMTVVQHHSTLYRISHFLLRGNQS